MVGTKKVSVGKEVSVGKKVSAGKPRPAPAKKTGAGAIPDRLAIDAYAKTVSKKDRAAAVAKAQDVMYDAWEKSTPRARETLARKALGLSPLCADAFNLLGDQASTPNEARDLYALGLHAGALALGPEGFEDYAGAFWGFLETRPYMRARHGLALALVALGETAEAAAHYRAMLELNPGDNQGVRYALLALLLKSDDTAARDTLLEAYPDEWSVTWLYTRALVAFRNGEAATQATRDLLADARRVNEHVPGFLAETDRLEGPRGPFVMFGGREEAADYIRDFGDAWRNTDGAIAWLVAAPPPSKAPGKGAAKEAP
jgi:tetratricopeptide (TPR) repeat protein